MYTLRTSTGKQFTVCNGQKHLTTATRITTQQGRLSQAPAHPPNLLPHQKDNGMKPIRVYIAAQLGLNSAQQHQAYHQFQEEPHRQAFRLVIIYAHGAREWILTVTEDKGSGNHRGQGCAKVLIAQWQTLPWISAQCHTFPWSNRQGLVLSATHSLGATDRTQCSVTHPPQSN